MIIVTTVSYVKLRKLPIDWKYLQEFESDANKTKLEDMISTAISNDKKLFFKSKVRVYIFHLIPYIYSLANPKFQEKDFKKKRQYIILRC